jgi:hypothetical protein
MELSQNYTIATAQLKNAKLGLESFKGEKRPRTGTSNLLLPLSSKNHFVLPR